MSDPQSSLALPVTRLTRRKTLDQVTAECQSHDLKRTLTATQLTLLGVGATIGAGIYVMTGEAAADYAGPAVLVSFVIAALACLFTAFSYGELSSTLPVAGSAYSYAYVSIGEGAAWTVGWLLLLEYGISCAAVASGLSGYATSLLSDLGVHVPSALSQSTFQTVLSGANLTLTVGPRLDFVGGLAVMIVTALLVRGVQESARVNAVIVVIKVGVLFVFVGFGLEAMHAAYWHPFIPQSEGGFRYGLPGVFRAASIIFFAYVGFEAVSTAAAEARNPRRDVPIGIVLSLVICTAVYILVASVLIGIVPYRELGVADPLAIAVNAMHEPWLALLIKVGATVGLCSVLLGLLYGQTRIFFSMSRDGLIPAAFSRVHPTLRTPWIGTILLGILVAIATATMPLEVISDLVSIGTACAFGIVNFTVIWQRNTRPGITRPFSVPLGGITIGGFWIGIAPALGIAFCVIMTLPLCIDLLRALGNGNPLPAILLGIYIVIGIATYFAYGRSHSRMAQAPFDAD
jgi:basic amino acid/polyamine antiporter, APA family